MMMMMLMITCGDIVDGEVVKMPSDNVALGPTLAPGFDHSDADYDADDDDDHHHHGEKDDEKDYDNETADDDGDDHETDHMALKPIPILYIIWWFNHDNHGDVNEKKPSKPTNNRIRKQRIPDVEEGDVSSESLLSVKTTSQTIRILVISIRNHHHGHQ